MTSRSTYRPRRTRIYGANYDIGESYYKKQLEDLENKRRPTRLNDDTFRVDFALNDDKVAPKLSFLHKNEDDDFSTNSALKAFNKKLFTAETDDDWTSRASAPRFNQFDREMFEDSKTFSKKTLDSKFKERTPFGNDLDNEMLDSFASRRVKIRSKNLLFEDENKAEMEASSRFKATKARLADLESEMLSISERQNEREKRNHSLRKLLNESDAFTSVTDV